MTQLTYTLVADGSSDQVLIPIIDWVLRQHSSKVIVQQFVSSVEVRASGLTQRVARAIALFPCDILFVHRDAEHPDRVADRREEIKFAVSGLGLRFIPLVPIRMTEAWLLIFEAAIRRAANNPNGKVNLLLPDARVVERIVDPKALLYEKLRTATELPPRRLHNFNEARARRRISELVENFSALRNVCAFNEFEAEVRSSLRVIEFEE